MPDTPEVPTHTAEPPDEAERTLVALDHEIATAVTRLERLRERGLLTDDEFQVAMDRVIEPEPPEAPSGSGAA